VTGQGHSGNSTVRGTPAHENVVGYRRTPMFVVRAIRPYCT
jgi:hypothetical protein